MQVLGLILARGGSKRLPGKNMLPLRGVPLIGWTIAVAKQSTTLSLILVSSDDANIRTFSRACGVRAVNRPARFAADSTTSYDSIRFVLRTPQYRRFDYICLLQPTSPFRAPHDIDYAVQQVADNKLPAIKSCQEGEIHGNGAVYVATPDWLLDGGSWDDLSVPSFEMPAVRSIDIDTAEDFAEAERMLDSAGAPASLTLIS